MQRQQTRLGTCPRCDDVLHSQHILITYEADGETARFAECQGCQAVVHPETE